MPILMAAILSAINQFVCAVLKFSIWFVLTPWPTLIYQVTPTATLPDTANIFVGEASSWIIPNQLVELTELEPTSS